MTYADMPETFGNLWVRGLDHKATLVCDRCKGVGVNERDVWNPYTSLAVVETCFACNGTGHIEIGCGGIGCAERDVHYGMAACWNCGRDAGMTKAMIVDAREVPLKTSGD